MKRAIVVGSGGQDGRILTRRLVGEGAGVLGIERRRAFISASGETDPVDILDRQSVLRAVSSFAPDEVYYLAARHGSSEAAGAEEGADLYEESHGIHVRGLLHFLEALRRARPSCSLFYAASSRIFGEPGTEVQDETTPLAPTCVYGITKAAGVLCCRLYRRVHGVRASVGILYNHESLSRRREFVSRKIIEGALDVQRGRERSVALGDLQARVDWGYAPDFVDAMIRILALEEAEDFVVATGESHSVEEFARTVFSLAGLDFGEGVVEDSSAGVRRRPTLVGNARKLRARTGWTPSVSFQEMIRVLWRAASEADEGPSGACRPEP